MLFSAMSHTPYMLSTSLNSNSFCWPVPVRYTSPPLPLAELPQMMLLYTFSNSTMPFTWNNTPPPLPAAVLAEMVLLIMKRVDVASTQTPPPWELELLRILSIKLSSRLTV